MGSGKIQDNIDFGEYQVGLKKDEEAVISAHFMHEINLDSTLSLYDDAEISEKTCVISMDDFYRKLIPHLIEASEEFIKNRADSAKKRAADNFEKYGLLSKKDIGINHIITEIMFDRQFLKGAKSNASRMSTLSKVDALIKQGKNINMVIPALPYKSSSPLKCRGVGPDMAEINFLLSLYEMSKTIDLVYREYLKADSPLAKFTVICDGNRFNRFLNEPDESIENYQNNLVALCNKLNFVEYIEITDYRKTLDERLTESMLVEKQKKRKDAVARYGKIMNPLLNYYDMNASIEAAISNDPDPELINREGRFVPLFKSIIYIVNYRCLEKYSRLHGLDYSDLYKELTRNIFTPYAKLSEMDVVKVRAYIENQSGCIRPRMEKIYEYLRQQMIREAWDGAIHYVAEIISDRDMVKEPILTCFPDHLRWTIHAKPGQLAILTTTAFGDPIQPWHGTAVFKLSKKNRIKIYTLPVLSLEGNGATPVIVKSESEINTNCVDESSQPFFYIYPDIEFKSIDDFCGRLNKQLTRSRKH